MFETARASGCTDATFAEAAYTSAMERAYGKDAGNAR
jgi:hypothetical protein